MSYTRESSKWHFGANLTPPHNCGMNGDDGDDGDEYNSFLQFYQNNEGKVVIKGIFQINVCFYLTQIFFKYIYISTRGSSKTILTNLVTVSGSFGYVDKMKRRFAWYP